VSHGKKYGMVGNVAWPTFRSGTDPISRGHHFISVHHYIYYIFSAISFNERLLDYI